MDPSTRTRPPVIKSQLVAEMEAESWTNANDLRSLVDAEGLQWQIKLTTAENLDTANPRRLLHETTIYLETSANAAMFIDTKTLIPGSDDRIIALLEQRTIPLSHRVGVISAPTQKAMRELLQQKIRSLREIMANKNLVALKRKLICSWIEKFREFGYHDAL